MMPRFPLRSLVLAAAAALAAPAAAGTLSIDPIKVEINAERRIASVRVTNEADEPVTIRGHALRWTQANGEDVTQEVNNVIISPPIATIPAKGTQLIRVGLRGAPKAGEAYRLIIEEVPQASPGGGVQVAIRLNLPLYVLLEQGEQSDLGFSAVQQADGRWAVDVSNRGTGYVRIDPDAAAAATGIDAQQIASIATVLPGGAKRALIDGSAINDRARFQSIVRTESDAADSLAKAR